MDYVSAHTKKKTEVFQRFLHRTQFSLSVVLDASHFNTIELRRGPLIVSIESARFQGLKLLDDNLFRDKLDKFTWLDV